eukprot:TRINITY_DN9974_c1_g2_i7.p1 TRINITY_DN9974_c1_g2~~TRINITY_DN9974_c1_g2_i7.p1  ORF type:complete len:135 (-),score=48.26 TRINITY_DN9974_c1_g2_i7:75-479(-)
MARFGACFVVASALATADASVVRPAVSLAAAKSSVNANSASRVVLEERIGDYKAVNPGFGEDACQAMFETKKKLGGSVPPNDFVTGCTEVCASAKAMKEYWGSGDMASYACEEVKKFGCVYDGTPPVTAADIGC